MVRLKLQRGQGMLKTAVLCFTLHLLEKVGGYSPPSPSGSAAHGHLVFVFQS